ncbi:unnamed protein product [Peniophora sp. CBMAI 1063]|nr:unnamed protein product [Peniophora sp. CBMAI 1063]
MSSETYEGYPQHAPGYYGQYDWSQSSPGVYAAWNRSQCSTTTSGRQSHNQLIGSVHHNQHQYTDGNLSYGVEPTHVYPYIDKQVPVSIHSPPAEVPAYHSSAIRSTTVPLDSPDSVSTTRASLLDAFHAQTFASSHSLNKDHVPMGDFEDPRHTSVLDSHSKHYQNDSVCTTQLGVDGSLCMTVPNVHYQLGTGSSCEPATPMMVNRHSPTPDTIEPAPMFQSPNDSAPLASLSSHQRAHLPALGSGADLLQYYVDLDRELLQTSWNPSDIFIKSGSSESGDYQLNLESEESPVAEITRRKKPSHQCRLRYVSEAVGFQITDP